jgi:hypothetical protein
MLLCLSSGFTERYRHDVLRAVSMPVGAELRFRYQLSIVSEDVKADIRQNNLVGQMACLAYVDRSVAGQTPVIVPCRQAKIRKTEVAGDFCVIEFELGSFWFANDVVAFNKDVRALAGNLTEWQGTILKGYFCCGLSTPPQSLVLSSEISDWQRLIVSLRDHSDFSAEPFFYFVRGIFQIGKQKAIQSIECSWPLLASSSYEMRIVQYTPGEAHSTNVMPRTSWLLAEASPSAVSLVTTPKLAIDSGYDIKRLLFRTVNTARRIDSMVTLFRLLNSPTPKPTDTSIWDFDVVFQIRPPLWTPIWQGLAVGALLAVQSLLIICSNAQISHKITVGCLSVLVGLLTGIVASFNLRKP